MSLARRDLEVMEWIGSQYAVREDQLAGLLGRSERTARRWSRAMCSAGYVRREWLLPGDPAWVWLNGRGTRMTEHGFSPWRPNVGRLRHIGAVSDLRLYLAQQVTDARWVSERELFRDRPNRGVHVPDAVLELDSERHALEVEFASKARKRLVAIVEELRATHDVVVYFCAPAPARLVEELREERGWPDVQVRALGDVVAGAGARHGLRGPVHSAAP